jgi:hypothetical protein
MPGSMKIERGVIQLAGSGLSTTQIATKLNMPLRSRTFLSPDNNNPEADNRGKHNCADDECPK